MQIREAFPIFLMVTKGEGVGGKNWEIGIDIYAPLYIK